MLNTATSAPTRAMKKDWTHPHRVHEKAIETHLHRIENEFRQGFDFIQKFPRSVSIFGSSMMKEDNRYYQACYELSRRLAHELKYAVVNGGGPGIMEAASRGAVDGGGKAVGLKIDNVREHTGKDYVSDGIHFTYFFTRKAMLAFAAEAYIFFPGGYGTMDELFSVLTLIQTGKIPRVPIIFYGVDYWSPLRDFIASRMLEGGLIDAHDMDLFEITDSADRAIEIVKDAPISEWWRNIN